MVRRAEISQPGMRLPLAAQSECLGQSRLPDPRLCRDHHDLTATCPRLSPSATKEFEFFLAANERRLANPQRLEATGDPALSKDTEGWHWRLQSFDLNLAEALVLE